MAVTNDPALAESIRLMSLHGLSTDAWGRYGGGGWDYRIVAAWVQIQPDGHRRSNRLPPTPASRGDAEADAKPLPSFI